MNYRRNFVSGGSYFFTVVTARRQPIFANKHAVDILRDVFRVVRENHPFRIDAIVVLPDHLHCIWTLPPDEADFPMRWRLIKSRFTRLCRPFLPGQARIWQSRYWEHTLRDEQDFIRHIEYIHYNPVKHGLVERPIEWSYSSFQRYVNAGIYPQYWGTETLDFDGIGRE